MRHFVPVINLGGVRVQYVRVFFDKANQIVPVSHSLDSDAVFVTVAPPDKFCSIRTAPASNTKSSVSLVCDTDLISAVVRLEAPAVEG